jgi:2-polyprenyl-3-methyl-5-hydroxy-6-metoxy-1,4-benzoquinol methylase
MTHTPVYDVVTIGGVLSESFWDARYDQAEQIWSGSPNPQLVEHIQDQQPGSALDVGCGEGADAIWLARHGWQVTAMDISKRALERAQAAAADAGADIASRITWLHQDVLTWDDAGAQFDLVNAQYLHFTRDNAALHRRLAVLVRPGGVLLIVGHHPSLHTDDQHEGVSNPKDYLFESDTAAAVLDPAEWEIQVSATVERHASSAHKRTGLIPDALLLARRRLTPTRLSPRLSAAHSK